MTYDQWARTRGAEAAVEQVDECWGLRQLPGPSVVREREREREAVVRDLITRRVGCERLKGLELMLETEEMQLTLATEATLTSMRD